MTRHAISRRALLLTTAAAVAYVPLQTGAAPPVAAEPRTVVALYDSRLEPRIVGAKVHTHAAMPIEWLGMAVRYVDVAQGVYPEVWADPAVRGVVTWFPEPSFSDFPAFVAWAEHAAAAGVRIVLMGDVAPKPGSMGEDATDHWRARLFAAVGIHLSGNWSSTTLNDRIVHAEPERTGYERTLDGRFPPYEVFSPAIPGTSSWLVIERASVARETSHLVMITPKGGFVAPRWDTVSDPHSDTQAWFIDPFAFFEAAFGAASLPRADTTTLCGRRMFYSHIDGDGWRSLSRVHTETGTPATTAEIILRKIVEPNPDLPVTVAPIAAEMDLARSGNTRAIEVARALFTLPQVEPATHTYTHPFQWSFFEDYSAAKEQPYSQAYKHAEDAKHQLAEAGVGAADDGTPANGANCCALARAYALPRAFGTRPFDLEEEIGGSVRQITTLCPPGKQIALLQWPGDCQPFARAQQLVSAQGLLNLNGGDTRFDDSTPTVSGVRPVGVGHGDLVQVYASNSSEELYTELWSNRFFGFRDLPVTWDRTETPRRLKPLNLYYHMYSGERLASVKALQSNIADLRTREFIGVRASRFAAIGKGFFSLQLVPQGKGWRVLNRGGLATLRFGGAGGMMADMDASRGVLGDRVAGQELYVALDPAVDAPLVVLRRRDGTVSRPSLVHASWEVSKLHVDGPSFTFDATGLGGGDLHWRVPAGGEWVASAGDWSGRATAGDDGLLKISIPALAAGGVAVSLRRA